MKRSTDPNTQKSEQVSVKIGRPTRVLRSTEKTLVIKVLDLFNTELTQLESAQSDTPTESYEFLNDPYSNWSHITDQTKSSNISMKTTSNRKPVLMKVVETSKIKPNHLESSQMDAPTESYEFCTEISSKNSLIQLTLAPLFK